MKNSIVILIISVFFVSNSYSQIDDILKKIPGVEDVVFEKAVTTNIKDAFPQALWLKDIDKQLKTQTDTRFSSDLSPGLYRFKLNTFCLHAGTYGPTEGSGYLVAPLKGNKAGLIKNILERYSSHPEIDQKDAQLLIWGVEAEQKFSDYSRDFQLRVAPLLTLEEIAEMEIDVKEIAYELIPEELKEVLNLYKQLRMKLSDASSTYDDIERLAVKTGIAPQGRGSIQIEEGTWTSIGDGVYMRSFTSIYPKTDVEVYIPAKINLEKDNTGKLISADDGSCKIEFQYEARTTKLKSVLIKDLSAETTIDINPSVKLQVDEFINSVKKSFIKKRSRLLTSESIKTIALLKTTELNLRPNDGSLSQGGYTLCVDAVNSFISSIESGNKKGGSKSTITGLNDIYGLVFAPSNTKKQRLGNGGPEGGNQNDTNCKPEVTLRNVSYDYLPIPGSSLVMYIEIRNLGSNCKIEETQFTLVSTRERGRCLNDKDSAWFDSRLDFYIDPANGNFNVNSDSLFATSGSGATSIVIGCNDYGGFARLSAGVKIKGKWYFAKDESSSKQYVTIPRDKDENRIADKWETDRNVAGFSAGWDEDPQPQDQKIDGDGMTNYEEYRGFLTSETAGGTIEHIRMNPNSKEIFVIDDGRLLSKKAWETATGIGVYFLTKNEVYGELAGQDIDFNYRWVNFNKGYSNGIKFAINIIKVDGLQDPYGYYPDPDKAFAYADMINPPLPKNCKKVVVMRDRVARSVKDIVDRLEFVLNNTPGSPIGFDGTNIIRNEAENLVNFMKISSNFNLFVDYQMVLTMIHEIGHACGTVHHGAGESGKEGTGAEWCPMRYISIQDQLKWVNIIQGFNSKDDFNSWYYCSPPDKDDCWGQLNVNDR